MCRNDIDNLESDTVCKYFTWKEVEAHATQPECWIVVHDCVYDLAKFKRKHPGGAKLLGHFAGQDATVCTISKILFCDFYVLFKCHLICF